MTDEIRPPGAGEPPARSFYPRRWASLGLLLAAVLSRSSEPVGRAMARLERR